MKEIDKIYKYELNKKIEDVIYEIKKELTKKIETETAEKVRKALFKQEEVMEMLNCSQATL